LKSKEEKKVSISAKIHPKIRELSLKSAAKRGLSFSLYVESALKFLNKYSK